MQIKLNLLQKHIFNVQKIQKLKTKRFQRQVKQNLLKIRSMWIIRQLRNKNLLEQNSTAWNI